jgi:hypothetical protein
VSQATQQILKGDGGALSLTEDEEKLSRWMISGPEVAHLVKTCEEDRVLKSLKYSEYRHHEKLQLFLKKPDRRV